MQKNRRVRQSSAQIETVAEEFFRHNEARGLAIETCSTYRTYVKQFAEWYGPYRSSSAVETR